MTPMQHRVYDYIRSYIEQYSYSPSLVEIARGIGISSKSISLISRQVHALVQAGRLRISKGYRSIQLAEPSLLSLPLLGRIAAGAPIEAIQDPYNIDLGVYFKGVDHFLLEVKGNSMIEEGIFDGDLIICKRTQQAQEGEIVVALIDGLDATLKRLSYKIPDRVTLIPANHLLKPKAYLPHRIHIQGIFIGLLRLKK